MEGQDELFRKMFKDAPALRRRQPVAHVRPEEVPADKVVVPQCVLPPAPRQPLLGRQRLVVARRPHKVVVHVQYPLVVVAVWGP